MRALLVLMMMLLTACQGGEGERREVAQERGEILLSESHGRGAAWGLADCAACHVLDNLHTRATSVRDTVRAKGYTTCTGCHGSNGTAEPRRCQVCHNTNDLPTVPRSTGAHGHSFGRPTLGDDDCLACHDASDMDGTFEPTIDLTVFPDLAQALTPYANISEFCLRCHNRDHQQPGYAIAGSSYDDPLIGAEDHYRYIDKHGLVHGSGARTYAGLRAGYAYQSVVECTDCHSMHGTSNTGLVIARSDQGVTQLDPALRLAPYAVYTADGDLSQLCVLCHQMETVLNQGAQDTGNGLAGVHEVGTDCRSCHHHGEAVQAGM